MSAGKIGPLVLPSLELHDEGPTVVRVAANYHDRALSPDDVRAVHAWAVRWIAAHLPEPGSDDRPMLAGESPGGDPRKMRGGKLRPNRTGKRGAARPR